MKIITVIISIFFLVFSLNAQQENKESSSSDVVRNNELEQIFNNIISNISEEEKSTINIATQETSSDSNSGGSNNEIKTSEIGYNLHVNTEVQLDNLPQELKERVLKRMKEIEASREQKVKEYKK